MSRGTSPRVIQMRVGQNDRVYGFWFELEWKAISLGKLRMTLDKAAIDQDALRIAFDKKARTGHGLGGPEELDAQHGKRRRKRNARGA